MQFPWQTDTSVGKNHGHTLMEKKIKARSKLYMT